MTRPSEGPFPGHPFVRSGVPEAPLIAALSVSLDDGVPRHTGATLAASTGASTKGFMHRLGALVS